MKILALLGTRPEIIRLSSVLRALDQRHELVICYSGQNSDPNLSEIFLRELAIPAVRHSLNLGNSDVHTFLAALFGRFSEVLETEQPDAVLVLGDTNSALGALLAGKVGIPVYHLEAGNRSFDKRVPEERNRRILDHSADFNLAYTEHARRHLLAEGLHPRTIAVIGSPLREVMNEHLPQFDDAAACRTAGVVEGEYLLVSAHRAENVDDPSQLAGLLDGCERLARTLDARLLVSAHPRLRKMLGSHERSNWWTFSDPFGYFQYMALQRSARLVISDSGSVPEEAAILGFPAITPRWSTERPEAIETGSVVLTSTDPSYMHEVGVATVRAWEEGHRPACPTDYMIENTSARVTAFIESTCRVAPFWLGTSGPQ